MKLITARNENNSSLLLEDFNYLQCLSSNENSYTYYVQHKESSHLSILKICTNHTFSKYKFRIVSRFLDNYFCIPKLYKHINSTAYVILEPMVSLRDIISSTGLSFLDLLNLATDLTHIGIFLKKVRFYETDVSPNNIYRHSSGSFCLGDLNIQKDSPIGTPPYISPERKHKSSSRNKMRSSSFDKSFQFSLCMILRNIYELDKESSIPSFEQIIEKGLQENPEKRFSSLAELKNSFEKIKETDAINTSFLFQTKTESHPLFETKTQMIIKKENSFLFVILWIGIIIFGCIFLSLYYHQLHKKDTVKLKESPIEKVLLSPTPLTKDKELDIQKNGLSSLPHNSSDADTVTCIYAGENKITEINSDFCYFNLKELYLNDNLLNNISGLSNSKDLEILCLSYNHIENIKPLTELKKLTFLDIASNHKFSDIQSLIQMKQLTTLNISNTDISKKEYNFQRQQLPNCTIIY